MQRRAACRTSASAYCGDVTSRRHCWSPNWRINDSNTPRVNGDWLCQWEMAIFDPLQNRHALTDHQKISRRWLRCRPPTALPNLVRIRPPGSFWRMGEIHCSKKVDHQTHGGTFVKSEAIFKIHLSLKRKLNSQQNSYNIVHHTSCMFPHYLWKFNLSQIWKNMQTRNVICLDFWRPSILMYIAYLLIALVFGFR